MDACEEATAHILNLTHQVARLKQMATTEQIQRGQIITVGEEAMRAWMEGNPYSEILHARWVSATDPQTIEKKFRQINKEFDNKEKEHREQLMMTPEERKQQAAEEAEKGKPAKKKGK